MTNKGIPYTLERLLEEKAPSFTRNEHRIASAVLQDCASVVFLSITDLAERAGVGDASVTRFCKKLGFATYQQFKMTLAQSLGGGVENTPIVHIAPDDPMDVMAGKIQDFYIHTLQQTARTVDLDAIDRAVNRMLCARRIVFFGVGSSGMAAQTARTRFMRIIPGVEGSVDGHMQVMTAALLRPDELAILYTRSGSTTDMIEIVKLAKAAGAQRICITHHAKSPVASLSEIVLSTASEEGPFQGGAFSTILSQLYVTDLLYTEYYRRTHESSQRNLELCTQAVSNKLV